MKGAASRFVDWLNQCLPLVNAELDRVLPAPTVWPERLHRAMRDAVLGGGKRVRPALLLGLVRALGGEFRELLPVAAAVELLHTSSLVHDDLPALDNDDWRRGRPTLHRLYGEASAILAGDALVALGFELLAREPAGAPGTERAEAVRLGAEAVSSRGLLGGQQEDLASEGCWPEDPEAAFLRIARAKTGVLFGACLELAALYAGCSAEARAGYRQFGTLLGEVFQLRDDLLDVLAERGELGKTPGKDARQKKLTAVALWGVEETQRRLATRMKDGLELLQTLSNPPALLADALAFASERGF